VAVVIGSAKTQSENLREALRLNEEGEALFNQFDFAGAIAHYLKAQELAPELATLHINLGVAHLYQGDWLMGLEHLARAATIIPSDEDLAHNCQSLLNMLGVNASGSDSYEAAVTQLGGKLGEMLRQRQPDITDSAIDQALKHLTLLAFIADLHRDAETTPVAPPPPPEPVNESFLARQREFWNVTDVRTAKFERIVTDPSIARMPPDEQERVWSESIDRAVGQILKGLPAQANWRVLDIGCGIGRLVKPLRQRFAQVDGVDIAENMIRMAQDYLADGPQNGRVLVNSGADLRELANVGYDLVYSVLTFQHIRSASVVRSYLRDIYRVLKPGGWCRIQVLDRISPRLGRWDEEAKPDQQYGFFGNGYTAQEFRQLLAEHGFAEVLVTTDRNWHWGTGRKPTR
jgi:SAM-dependent methyltransferase